MCGFIVANFIIAANITASSNSKVQRRGPDLTSRVTVQGVEFVHNLLQLTGPATIQPLLEPDRGGAAVFNGEVYNYVRLAKELALPAGQSDGHVLLSAYRQWGSTFIRRLDCELALAIIDFRNQQVVLARDAFGTKPLWIARDSDHRWAIASYRSALSELGFENPELIGPNVVLTCNLKDLDLCSEWRPWRFDLRQWKTSTRDWREAFELAVAKRASQGEDAPNPRVFIGLSSGHDSGAIHVELLNQRRKHAAYVLLSYEPRDIINSRIRYAQELDDGVGRAEAAVLEVTQDQFFWEREWIASYTELFESLDYKAMGNPSFIGTSIICREAAASQYRVMLTGHGADETMTNYGNKGLPIMEKGEAVVNSSSFDFFGLYPSNLSEVFPWANFFRGSNRDFLNTIDVACGAHGVEARYPFLDPRVVQEWLWLAPEVKNSVYKMPIEELLQSSGYPYLPASKAGFGANSNLNSFRWQGRAWATSEKLLRPIEDVLPPTFVPYDLAELPSDSFEVNNLCLYENMPPFFVAIFTGLWKMAIKLNHHPLLESFLASCCYRRGHSEDAQNCVATIMNWRDAFGDTALQIAESDANHDLVTILRRLACLVKGSRQTAMFTLGEKGLQVGERLQVVQSMAGLQEQLHERRASDSRISEHILASRNRIVQFCNGTSFGIPLDGLEQASSELLMNSLYMLVEQTLGDAENLDVPGVLEHVHTILAS